MTSYERLDILLKENGETYTSISKRLGISKFMIPQGKSRNSELNDVLIKEISSIFYISETWLRWGYVEDSWVEKSIENEITPEKIIIRLEDQISFITGNHNKQSEDFFDFIEEYICKKEIYSIKKRRKNIDLPLFIKIAEKLVISLDYLLTGNSTSKISSTWRIPIPEKYDSMFKAFNCITDVNKQMIEKQIANAFFSEKYHKENLND